MNVGSWTNGPAYFRALLARPRPTVQFLSVWISVDMWTSCGHLRGHPARPAPSARTRVRIWRASVGPRVTKPVKYATAVAPA